MIVAQKSNLFSFSSFQIGVKCACQLQQFAVELECRHNNNNKQSWEAFKLLLAVSVDDLGCLALAVVDRFAVCLNATALYSSVVINCRSPCWYSWEMNYLDREKMEHRVGLLMGWKWILTAVNSSQTDNREESTATGDAALQRLSLADWPMTLPDSHSIILSP